MKRLFQSALSYLRIVFGWLSDGRHRRFVAVILAMAITHFVGKVFDADQISDAIDIVIGGLGGAWTHTVGEAS